MIRRIFKGSPAPKFPSHAVLRGMGRILDIAGSSRVDVRQKSISEDSWSTDSEALQSDWENVGNDMRAACVVFRKNMTKDGKGAVKRRMASENG